MKQAVFLVTDYGVDGRAPENIIYASTDEQERDDWYEASKNKAWYSKVDRVADLKEVAQQGWNKLDSLERLGFWQADAPIWDGCLDDHDIIPPDRNKQGRQPRGLDVESED